MNDTDNALEPAATTDAVFEGQVVMDEAGIGGVDLLAVAGLGPLGEWPIGRGRSDVNGCFVLAPDDEREARARRQALCLGAPVCVRAVQGDVELTQVPRLTGQPLKLTVSRHPGADRIGWEALAPMAADGNIARVGELASELRSLTARGVFAQVPVGERLAAYQAIQRSISAFADEQALPLIAYFGAVEANPINVDFGALKRGDLVKGLFKITSVQVPAKKARIGIDPFTKQERKFAAKPATTKVKVRAMKKLEDAALA